MTISIGHHSLRVATPGNILLWLIAAFHLLLAAALFAVLFSVSAAQAADDTCTGKNLMTELQQNRSRPLRRGRQGGRCDTERQGHFLENRKARPQALVAARQHACHRSARAEPAAVRPGGP